MRAGALDSNLQNNLRKGHRSFVLPERTTATEDHCNRSSDRYHSEHGISISPSTALCASGLCEDWLIQYLNRSSAMSCKHRVHDDQSRFDSIAVLLAPNRRFCPSSDNLLSKSPRPTGSGSRVQRNRLKFRFVTATAKHGKASLDGLHQALPL